MIKAIVAVAANWGIGKSNGLLFNLPLDMKRFREETKNSIVVCGENTLLSFPNAKPLKGRSTIVLCPEGHEYENCICVHDFDQLVKIVKVLSITNTVFIIGGGMMYKSMLPYYDEILVNKVAYIRSDATVYFPNLDEMREFEIAKKEDVVLDNGYNTQFCTYRRKPIEEQKLKLVKNFKITDENVDLFTEALNK